MNRAEEDALVAQARPVGTTNVSREAIRLAIRAAVAHERERCAKKLLDARSMDNLQIAAELTKLAAAIRRGE